MKKVLLVEPIHSSGVRILEEAGLMTIVSPSTDTATLADLARDDIFGIIVRTSLLEGKVLEAGKQLKIVARHGIGYNNIDLETAGKLNILVTNVPDANSYSVAEYAIAVILMLSRKIVPADAALRAGRLSQPGASLPGLVKKLNLGGNELPGRRLGLIGLGKIGAQVAEMAFAFLHMEVIACDPYRREAPPYIKLVADIKEVYGSADFISLHVPLTPETENMINAGTLSWMKPSAYLINASRGELIDDAALADALKSGQIAGAVLDVFRQEPPAVTGPLFSAPNLILTPHIAGSTDEAVERLALGSARAVADYYSGRKPAHIVNPQVWERL
jgi:D-3-phosphoglycerate dehydrogenase